MLHNSNVKCSNGLVYILHFFFLKLVERKHTVYIGKARTYRLQKKLPSATKKQQRDRITFTSKSSKSAVRQIIARERHIFV